MSSKPVKRKEKFEDKIKKDERFAGISTDPKFMTAPKSVKKVKVDKRFNKMIKDKNFIASAHKDKLNKMYEFEEDEEDTENKNKILDEDGNFVWNEQSDSSSEEEEQPKQELEEEDEGYWSDLQDEVKLGEDQTSKLAVQNLDWDHIGAEDLYFLFSSFCKGESMVLKVEIRPSEYGKQKMQNDSLAGPPTAIFSHKELDEKKKKFKIKRAEKKNEKKVLHNKVSALEVEDNYEFDEMELRKYEAQKMKYYFGVIYCDSPATAAHLYSEIDGLEFEQSQLKMDLRFIPDEIKEFPHAPKEEWTEAPEEYEWNFFANRAIGHTKVKLTWDEDDPKRMKVIKKKWEVDKLEDQDFKEYIASSDPEFSSEEDEQEIARKRAILGLDNSESESDEEINQAFGVAAKKKKKKEVTGDIKITFQSGFENIGDTLLQSKKDNEAKKKESAYETYQRERKQKKRDRKMKEKEKKEIDKEMMYEKPEEGAKKKHKKHKLKNLISEDAATKDELTLLMTGDQTKDDFEPDTTDKRFEAIYDSGAFNMDPTHKDFKKVGKAFVNEHQKRRWKGER